MSDRANANTLIGRTGWFYYPVAFVARLPFSMAVIGVLTLVVSARGSIELGGFNSAVVGLGVAIFGPIIGAAADRYGQRPTLLIVGALNSVMLCVLSWLAFSDAPVWLLFLASFITGATVPQTSPMSRSRLVVIIVNDLPPERRPRTLSTAMAYESTADEVIFVFGPVVVGLLATTLGAWAPMVGAAVLTLVFVTTFALHPTGRRRTSQAERAATLAPASELFRPALLVTVVGIFAVGLFFGSMFTSLTAFMQDLGSAESAGLVYGIMGIGSAIFALGIVLLPAAFSQRARWLVFALTILAGTVLLQTLSGLSGMLISLAFMGIAIGPLLVTLYSLGAKRSPVGRSATVMTMLGSSIMVGQSISAAVAGVVATELGTAAALFLPCIAAIVMVLAGIMNWFLSRGEGPSGLTEPNTVVADRDD